MEKNHYKNIKLKILLFYRFIHNYNNEITLKVSQLIHFSNLFLLELILIRWNYYLESCFVLFNVLK